MLQPLFGSNLMLALTSSTANAVPLPLRGRLFGSGLMLALEEEFWKMPSVLSLPLRGRWHAVGMTDEGLPTFL